MGKEIVPPFGYVKPVKYSFQNSHFESLILAIKAQTMCLEKTNVISIRWIFQISLWYKSNTGKKIIPTRLETKPPIFSQRELKSVPDIFSSGLTSK